MAQYKTVCTFPRNPSFKQKTQLVFEKTVTEMKSPIFS